MGGLLYHGSKVSDIEILKASSILHGSNENVVYLTDSFPYALFYVWDEKRNIKKGKHITAWVKDGIVYYEEQFKGQLKAFYDGVNGYIYSVECKNQFLKVQDRESIWYSRKDTAPCRVTEITDVYQKILNYEQEGKIKIVRFAETDAARIEMIYKNIADNIIKNGLLKKPDERDSIFYKRYFKAAWKMAELRGNEKL